MEVCHIHGRAYKHYLFAKKFGRPGKGNDKGKVEGLVGAWTDCHGNPELTTTASLGSRDGGVARASLGNEDAKATYPMRLKLGDEAFRKAMAQQFFGTSTAAA